MATKEGQTAAWTCLIKTEGQTAGRRGQGGGCDSESGH